MLKPRDSFRECAVCPELVVLPAGSFMMGSPEDEWGRMDDEIQREVRRMLAPCPARRGFRITRTLTP